MRVVKEGPPIGREQRYPRWVAVLLVLWVVAVCVVVVVVLRRLPRTKPDPWLGTKEVISRACNVSAADLTYAGGDYDHDLQGHPIGRAWAVKFTASGRPPIYVPYDPQIGFQGTQGEVICDAQR